MTFCLFYPTVQLRLNSIKNIGKITKSMKMIASTKVNKAQRAMEQARVYGASSASTFFVCR
jgi:F-type H+-transporting ATPase subunit gamma